MNDQIHEIPLSAIVDNPWQTRLHYDPGYIAELAADIKANGLLHAVVGRLRLRGKPLDYELYGGVKAALLDEPDARVELAIGHNRVRAYRLLFEKDPWYGTIPLRLGEYDDQTMARMAWSENAQRKDLTPFEEMKAIDKAMHDFGWSQEQAGMHFGINRTTISNKLRLLKHLPKELLQKLHQGEITERQAAAFIPLYQLPEPARKAAEAPGNNWTPTPAGLLESAATGGLSSDQLRTQVARAVELATLDLGTASWPLDHDFAGGSDKPRRYGFQAGRCTDCPMLIKQGEGQRCGDKSCFNTKRDHWRDRVMAEASRLTGLESLDTNARGHWRHENLWGDEAHGAAIFATSCPRNQLRLDYDPHGSYGVRLETMTNVRVVCDREEGRSCYCLQARKREAAAADPAEQAEKEDQQRLKNEVLAPAVAALAQALEAMQPEAWRLIIDHMTRHGGIEDWHKQCRKLAAARLEYAPPWNGHRNLEKSRAAVDAVLKQAGIVADYPEIAADLEQLRAKFERVRRWIRNLDMVIPTPVAVAGNLINLEKLADQIGDEDSEEAAELAHEIMCCIEALEELEKLLQNPVAVADLAETHRDGDLTTLFHTPTNAMMFDSVLERVRPAAIHYSLALALANSDRMRIEALERRLDELREEIG